MSKANNKPKKEKTPSPPGTDLAIIAWLWICGVLVWFFPTYADLTGAWVWPFRVVSYALYLIALLSTAVGIGKLRNSQFLIHLGIGAVFLGAAYGLHWWSTSVGTEWIKVTIRLGSVVLVMIASIMWLSAIPHLFQRPPLAADQQASKDIGAGEQSHGVLVNRGSRTSTAVALIVAVLTVVSAALPLVRWWLTGDGT